MSATDLRLAVLCAAGAGLLVATIVTRRRPTEPVPDLDGYFLRWRALHGGYDVSTGSAWLRGWLRIAYQVGRPLARAGTAPDVLTAWTLWLTAAALVCAAAGGRWALLGCVLLVIGGLGDALDGCVAVLTQRATAWGYVLDSLIDRINDALCVLALVVLGAPPAPAVGCVAAAFLLEYVRARAGNAGGGVIGTITVGERANRVAFSAAGLLGAGILPTRAAQIATTALWVLTALSVAGLTQVVVAVRQELGGRPAGAGSGGPHEIRHDPSGEQYERQPPAGM